jgi:hydroxymethylpyrimidine/phosphomethylpyrimidine kinase
MRTVLTIAGFDPSGGAGVAADLKTFAALKTYGIAVVTSLTSQNTQQVYATFHQSVEVVKAQLIPLCEDFQIDAVKIGMLPTCELIEFVAATITAYNLKNVVLDPVFRSSSGHDLIDAEARGSLVEKLFPLATVITPNLDETSALLQRSITNEAEMKAAAREIQKNTNSSAAVLIKGGHLEGAALDVLFHDEVAKIFSVPRILTRNTHGTGCTLSSALAANLAHGATISAAVQQAKNYVTEALKKSLTVGKGKGSLNHFHHL